MTSQPASGGIKRESYRQQSQLYINDGPDPFSDVSASFQEKHVGRGAAFGDLDNDGDIDVIVISINEARSLTCGATETIDLIPGQSIKVIEKACRLAAKRPSRPSRGDR